MSLTKALVDTNICIDAAFERSPFATHALEIIDRSQRQDFTGMISAHSLDTIFYLLRKKKSKQETYGLLKDFRRAFDVAPVTQPIIDAAISLYWNDFEDAIHYQAAKVARCDAIITRNEKDFRQAELPVFSPQAFLGFNQ